MADIGALIANVMAAAKTATAIIPGMQSFGTALVVGEKLVGILDDLIGDDAPDVRTQAQMQAARKTLAAAVSAKAERTADRFD